MAKKGNTRRAKTSRQRLRKTRKQRGGQPLLQRLAQQAPKFPISGVRPMATIPSLFNPSFKTSGTIIPVSALPTFTREEIKQLLEMYKQPIIPRAPRDDLLKQLEKTLRNSGTLKNNISDSAKLPNNTAEVEEDIERVQPTVENTAKEMVEMIQANPLQTIPPTPDSYSPSERMTEALMLFQQYFSPSAKVKLNLSRLTPNNAALFQLTNTRIIKTRGTYTAKESEDFKKNMLQILDLILKNSTKDDINNIVNTFTPKRITELRLAIFSIWLQNPMIANNIITILFGDIIPRNKFSPELMDGMITILKDQNLNDILNNLRKVSQQITGTALDHTQQTVLAELKGKGWFKAQFLFRLLQYGLAALVLAIFICNDITSINTLAWRIGTEGGLSGLLETTQAKFAASNTGHTLGRLQEDLSNKLTFAREKLGPTNVFRKSPSELQQEYISWAEARRPKGLFEQARNYFSSKPAADAPKMK